jgi:hypothetical protein
MALNLKELREQLQKEVNVFAVAKEVYHLPDVDEKLDTKASVIERILGEEYRLAFL